MHALGYVSGTLTGVWVQGGGALEPAAVLSPLYCQLPVPTATTYSERKLFTGFTTAAFIA